jgi:hypothetical protein
MWDGQEIFGLNRSALESLLNALTSVDFAVLILTPDDVLVSRGIRKKSPRDNVLFELGLFMGNLGRDRTFVILDPDKVKISTDWAGITVATYDSTREILSAALGPACTLIRNHIRKTSLPQIYPSIHSGIESLTGYYEQHPLQELLQKIRHAQKEIFILQTWISSWAELIEALKEPLGLSGALVSGDAKVRIILADPESSLCEARGVHSGKPPGKTKMYAETSVEEITDFKRSFGLPNEILEIRLSTELPTFALFAADEEIYFTPYLRRRITVQSPCLLFRAGSGFGRELSEHFDSLWNTLAPCA